jgi:transposase-like protein
MHLATDTILRWLNQYCRTIYRFVGKFNPAIIPKVNIDELFLKMCNKFYYIWDAVCSDSRFAFFYFSDRRDNLSAERLIKQFIHAFFMVFDGAFQYPAVIKQLMGSSWYYHHTHRCKDFEDKKNNNAAERLQNFIRSLTHQRRGYKSLEGGRMHLKLLFTYYNFVRVHSAIKTTPAEKAGLIEYLDAETENKRWEFLIREGSRIIFYFLPTVF